MLYTAKIIWHPNLRNSHSPQAIVCLGEDEYVKLSCTRNDVTDATFKGPSAFVKGEIKDGPQTLMGTSQKNNGQIILTAEMYWGEAKFVPTDFAEEQEWQAGMS